MSAAVNHSSPTITRRYYDHFVRRSYSGALRSGLGMTEPTKPGEAPIVPLRNGTDE